MLKEVVTGTIETSGPTYRTQAPAVQHMKSSATKAKSVGFVERASQNIALDACWAKASYKPGVSGRLSSAGWQVCRLPSMQRRWWDLAPHWAQL